MWDENYRLVNRSIDTRRKEHNRRVEDAARCRIERACQQRQEAMQQLVTQVQPALSIRKTAPPVEGAAGIVHFFRERLQRTGESLRLFHFTLEFGRLRIELIRASGQKNPGAPHV